MLWRARAEGVVAAEIARRDAGGRGRPAAGRPAAGDRRQAGAERRRRRRGAARARRRRQRPLHRAAAGVAGDVTSRRAGADRARRALFRAGGGRHLHAARRRRRAAAAAARSGDAALLLAVPSRSSACSTFSFSGRLDRLDWVFYWADVVAILLLPPLFLHFTLVFPERPGAGRAATPAATLDAAALRAGAAARRRPRRAPVRGRGGDGDVVSTRHRGWSIASSSSICGRASSAACWSDARAAPGPLGHRAPAAALDRLGHGARRGAVRARLRAAVRARRRAVAADAELSAIPLSLIPLAYASAIVRYRLLDIEVIVKRALVYAAALAAIVAIYVGPAAGGRAGVPRRRSDGHNWVIALLATLVALLLAPPVKNAIQDTLDRAFYRDRYDYRRALVGFARDLNSDLDLEPPDRAAGDARRRDAARRSHGADARRTTGRDGHFRRSRTSGFGDASRRRCCERPASATRLVAGHTVALDDPMRAAASPSRRSSSGATPGFTTSCPACRRKARSRCWRSAATTRASR